jgi:hypothetical protein
MKDETIHTQLELGLTGSDEQNSLTSNVKTGLQEINGVIHFTVYQYLDKRHE